MKSKKAELKYITVKNKLLFFVLFFSFFVLCLIILCSPIENARCRTFDNYILVEWDSLNLFKKRFVIEVLKDNELVETYVIDSKHNYFKFADGEHGHKYHFNVYYYNNRSTISVSEKCIFIDFSKIPDLDIVNIYTDNEILPSFEEVHPSGNEGGVSIKNNEFVTGIISVSNKKSVITDQRMMIKVRGNTSAFTPYQTPYKIVLSEPVDLFQSGQNKYKDTEYLLIGRALNFNWVLGFFLSEYMGIEWQARYKFVNLIMNGDYRGCYLLVENIKKGPGRVNITDNGFLFENDAYFWNSTQYFKTKYQASNMGWTLKYPETFDENRIRELENYLNQFEEALYLEKNDAYLDYIDIDSFVSWLLVNDILASYDYAGTNMYFSIYDFNSSDNNSSKIKMVTNWDFDSVFDDRLTDQWSVIHDRLFFEQLLKSRLFRECYYKKFNSVSDSLESDISAFFSEFLQIYGDDIEESWNLTAIRFDMNINDINYQYDEILDNISKRITWMKPEMSGFLN